MSHGVVRLISCIIIESNSSSTSSSLCLFIKLLSNLLWQWWNHKRFGIILTRWLGRDYETLQFFFFFCACFLLNQKLNANLLLASCFFLFCSVTCGLPVSMTQDHGISHMAQLLLENLNQLTLKVLIKDSTNLFQINCTVNCYNSNFMQLLIPVMKKFIVLLTV